MTRPSLTKATFHAFLNRLLPGGLLLLALCASAASTFAQEAVAWTPGAGTAVSGMTLEKTGPEGWNAQAISTKALVSGNGNLPKAQLPKYVAMAYEGTDLLPTRTNEHVRDAIANGLTVAMDGSLVKFIEEGVQ